MPATDDRDAAWDDLQAVLPEGWSVSSPALDADGLWVVRATYRLPPLHPWREAFGATEVDALRALARQFRALREL
jgi:hypothetical protein